MRPLTSLRSACWDFLAAVQFLTRIPVPALSNEAASLPRAAVFFPLAGALVGAGSALLHLLLAPHLPRAVAAFFVLLYLVLITGALHEDGLADAADAFGGGASREKILLILRDSRIGSYGGVAIAFSLLGRLLLLTALPLARVPCYLIAAAVLSRWTILPLSFYLPPARAEAAGQGARIATRITTTTLIAGTLFSLILAVALLKQRSAAAVLVAVLVAALTGAYYKRRIGGVTGDCFGATVQLAELSIYLCGVWTP